MIHIHDKEVYKIAECNLLYDTISPPKHTKNLKSHYSHILNGYMNTRIGRETFKNFRIIFESVCGSTIVTRRLVEKTLLKIDAVMQWRTHSGNTTSNLRVKVGPTLTQLSATNVLKWDYHVDE